MKKREHLRRFPARNIFLPVFLSYLLMLLIPVLMGGVLYSASLRNSETLLEEDSVNMLEQTGTILDGIYQEVDRISAHIRVNTRIMNFNDIDSIYDPATMWQAIEYTSENILYPFTLSSSFISEYYVFLNKSELVVSPNLIYPSQKIYEMMLQFGTMDYQTFRETYLDTYQQKTFLPETTIRGDNKELEVIPYLQSIGTESEITGTIVIFLDAERIKGLLNQVETGEEGIVAVMDGEGRILVKISRGEGEWENGDSLKQDLPADEYYTFTHTSQISHWHYMSIQNKRLIKSRLSYFRIIIIRTIAFLLMLGLAAAFLLGIKYTKPFSSISRHLMLSEESEGFMSPGDIAENVGKLIRQKNLLQERLSAYKPQLKASYIENLISGSFNSTTALESMLEYVGISLAGTYKSVILFTFHQADYELDSALIEEYETKKLLLRETIANAVSGEYVLHDLSLSRILLIHSQDAAGREDYRKELSRTLLGISDVLNEQLYLHLFLSVSRIYTDIRYTNRAYSEASSLVDLNREGKEDDCLAWYGSKNLVPSLIYFPLELEQKLISAVQAGNAEQGTLIIDEIYGENGQKRDLPADYSQILMLNLKLTILRILESREFSKRDQFSETLNKIPSGATDLKSFFRSYRTLIKKISDEVSSRKVSHNTNLKKKIETFLKENYTDNQLSIAALSDEFKLSEIYFSRFFKEQFGINFHAYLENLRMNQARKLMDESTKPIKDIVAVVGYASLNTFSRAFRRKYGISPRDYRDR